jgi:aspartyl-tRNA(Asn)/glutamyl-tRNA(Gln) amidotransferase subunit A
VTELADCTVAELLESYGSKTASPVEALESCLGRIDRLDGSVGAVLTLLVDRSRRQAAESERRWARGDARQLEGIPYGLKDIIGTAGIRTTGGSMLYAENVPTESAALAQRLEDAGGVLVAKLNTFEFAGGSNATTSNPWDLDRWACGSSSGSAAAVAAHELPLTIGTDSGGSIIGPAVFCGVVGLKPTFGLVPRSGIMPLSWTLDHAGTLTRSTLDAALSLRVIAGHDTRDPTSSRHPVEDYVGKSDKTIEGVRLGIPTDWFFDLCDPEVDSAVRAAIAQLVDNGATVVDIDLPSTKLVDLHAMELTIFYAELSANHEITFDRLSEYGPEFQRLLVRSQFTSAADYLQALRSRHLVQLDFQRAFERVDALVVPGQICTAPLQDHLVARIGSDEYPLLDVLSRLTAVMNIVGVPTLSLPIGFDSLNLPIGMTVAARPFDERTCFRVGRAFEELTDFHLATPQLVEADISRAHEKGAAVSLDGIVLNPIRTDTKDSIW